MSEAKSKESLQRVSEVRGTGAIADLDKSIAHFLEAIKHDVNTHDTKSLQAHANEFDALIHEEMKRRFQDIKDDLDAFMKVFKAMAVYKAELSVILTEGGNKTLEQSEISYAQVLMTRIQDKMATLKLLLKKLK